MKFLLLFFIVANTSVWAQDTVRVKDLDKKHPTSFSQEMKYLYQGKPFTGVATEGVTPNFKKIQHYLAGQLHGLYVSFYENGQMKERCEYAYGRRHGKLQYYYNNGQRMSVMTYKAGAVIDTTRTWYNDGKAKSMEVYVPGKQYIDTYDIYYKNGQKHIEMRPTYQIRWHENGKQELKCKVVDGKMDGTVKYKNELGKVKKIETWENGELTQTIEKGGRK